MVCGLLALLVALAFWIHPAGPAMRLGISALDGLGVATLRADVAGFFAGAGALSIAGAIQDKARLLTAPLLLVGVALTGRLITAIVWGFESNMASPILIEAGLLVVLATGRRFLGPS